MDGNINDYTLRGNNTYKKLSQPGHQVDLNELSLSDLQKLVEMLRFYQLELETQNEELWSIQQQLAASRELYADLYDSAPVGYCTLNQEGIIIHANRTVANLLALPRNELTDQPFRHLVVDEDQHTFARHFQSLVTSRTQQTCDVRMRKADGSTFYASLESSVFQNGRNDSYRITITDSTERKQTEEALHQSNANLTRWVRELEKHNLEASLFNQMSHALQRCRAVEETYPIIEQFLAQLFHGQSGTLYLLDTSHTNLEAVASWGNIPLPELFPPQAACPVLRYKKIQAADQRAGQNVQAAYAQLPCAFPAETVPVSYLCVPLIVQDTVIGVFHMRKRSSASYQEHNRWIRIASMVAEHISLTLTNLRLREQLLELSIRDSLTNLFNRRYLEETLEREVNTATRTQQPVGVILIDIDHFKQYNDIYGHKAGDETLRKVAAFLQTHIRSGDIACRYGGEEFVLILPNAPLEMVVHRAEMLRHSIHQLQVEYGGQVLKPVTLSLGVASFPQHGTTAEAIIKEADKALYQAKATGRNCVVVAEECAPLSADS